MRQYFFEGQLRLDWGFGNPNVTGALIAMLMVGAWLFAFCGRWGFWTSLLLNLGLGMCLVETFSRGALIAFMAGLVPIILISRRPWIKSRWIGVVVVLLALGGYAWNLRATDRYGQGILSEDGSISNRWLIYRVVPRMMWDAPDGWGWHRSGEAFRQWYQPVGRREPYTHLISSHATWLVETGWPARAAYMLGWALILLLCAPSLHLGRWRSVTLGIWTCWGTAMIFSHVALEKWLWAPPAAALLLATAGRIVARQGLSRQQWLAIPAAVSVGVGVAMILGCLPLAGPALRLRNGTVTAEGNGRTKVKSVGVLCPDRRVLGEFYGQQIRRALAEDESRAWRFQVQWEALAPLDSGLDVIVVPGDAAKGVSNQEARALGSARSVLFLNPSVPSEALAKELPHLSRLRQVTGEMWSGTAKSVWLSLFQNNGKVNVAQLPMVGTFVPHWTSTLNFPEAPSS